MHTPFLSRVHTLVGQNELSFAKGDIAPMAYTGTVEAVVEALTTALAADDPKTLFLYSNRLLMGVIDYGLATKADVLKPKHRAERFGVAVAAGEYDLASKLLTSLHLTSALRSAPVVEKADNISWSAFDPSVVEDLITKLSDKRFDYIFLDGHDAYRPGFMVAAAIGARICAVRNAQDSGRDPKPQLLPGEAKYLAPRIQNKRVLVMGEDVASGNAVLSLADLVEVLAPVRKLKTAGCLALADHPKGVPNYYGQERSTF